jgi:hypothetical protein
MDKTFNLGELHVTVTAFKNIRVTCQMTDDHPLITARLSELPGWTTGLSMKKRPSMQPSKRPSLVPKEFSVRDISKIMSYFRDKVGLDKHR